MPHGVGIFNKHFLWGGLKTIFAISLSTILIFASYFWFPAKLHYQILERYTFRSLEESGLISLGVILPSTGPYQSVTNVEITWTGKQERIQKTNFEILKLSDYIEPEEMKEALIEYQVSLHRGKVSWDAPKPETQEPPPRDLDSNDPIFLELSSQVFEKEIEKRSLDIYNLTINYLNESNRYESGSRYSHDQTFLSVPGDCLDNASLLVGLYQAAGIQSYVVVGNILPDIPIGSIETIRIGECPGHAWVEMRAGETWTLADPSWMSRFPLLPLYGRNDGLHLSYGEIVKEQLALYETYFWVIDNGPLIEAKNSFLRYAASGPKNSTFQPGVEMKCTWDGRLLNSVITWLFIIFITFKFRRFIIT